MKKSFSFLALFFMGHLAMAQIPAYLPTNGLQCWYPFNGNANNEYGTGKNGTIIGAAPTTDRFGTANAAYLLNGDTDNITIDTTFFNVGWDDYTISCWSNSDVLDNTHNFNHAQAIINTIPHNGVAIYFNWGFLGHYLMYANSNPPAGTWDIMAAAPSMASSTINVWNHIVMVKQHDTDYYLYIDGALDTVYHRATTTVDSFCKIVLGRSDSSIIKEGFSGKIDDYGIWNTALGGCDVRRLYLSTPYLYITANPVDQSTSIGSTTTFSVTDTGTGNTHQWQENSGSGYTDLSNTAPYSGTTTNTLTITGATAAMSNRKYRCVVVHPGGCTDTSAFGKLYVHPVGLNSVNNAAISVSPNPASTEIVISGAGNVDIELYNSLGQKVLTAAHTDRASIALIPADVYTVILKRDGIQLHSSKLIKE